MKTENEGSNSFEHRSRRFVVYQFLILGGLVTISFLNEGVDLPHLIFGSAPTSPETRWGEIVIEAIAFLMFVLLELSFIQKLRHEIRVLHGLLPVCEHCHRIFHQHKWEPLADYITAHSMAHFHQTLCPDCFRQGVPHAEAKSSATEPRKWMG